MHRRDTFRAETETHKSIIPTMITTFGMTQGAYSDQMTVKLDMNDMFDNDWNGKKVAIVCEKAAEKYPFRTLSPLFSFFLRNLAPSET